MFPGETRDRQVRAQPQETGASVDKTRGASGADLVPEGHFTLSAQRLPLRTHLLPLLPRSHRAVRHVEGVLVHPQTSIPVPPARGEGLRSCPLNLRIHEHFEYLGYPGQLSVCSTILSPESQNP
jgi:hypothetical protein